MPRDIPKRPLLPVTIDYQRQMHSVRVEIAPDTSANLGNQLANFQVMSRNIRMTMLRDINHTDMKT